MIKTNNTTEKKAKKFKQVKTSKKVKLEKGQEIPKDAIDKYFVANTAEIFVPDKVVNVDNKGKIKLIDTLTKNKGIKKIKGKPVIKIENKNINGIIINQEGEKLMDRSKSLLSDIEKRKNKEYGKLSKDMDELRINIAKTKFKEKKDLQKQRDILSRKSDLLGDELETIRLQKLINKPSLIKTYNQYKDAKLKEIKRGY
jgi:hypothetical protein